MGVDTTGRAKYRKGELRLVLGLPEPWTETQRDDFMKAVEALTRDVGVAPGDVHIQSALLTSWNPSDEIPAGVVTSADIEKLIIKFGVDQPRLQLEAWEKGYALGKLHGAEARAKAAAALAEQEQTVQLPIVVPYASSSAPYFNLAPLTEAERARESAAQIRLTHTCTECGETLDVCDAKGCGGAKHAGFRYGPRTAAEEFATAADPLLVDPHADEAAAGSYPAASLEWPAATEADEPGTPSTCIESRCLIRHSTETSHVWGYEGEEGIDQLQKAGKLCNDSGCADYHYLNDGSAHMHSEG